MSEEQSDREKVCQLARKWGIKVNIYRTNEILMKQVNWRVACRSIIKKWKRFPTDIVSTILVFVGNESEMNSAITDKQLEKVRKSQLAKFRKTASLWGQFNSVVIHSEIRLDMGHISTKIQQLLLENIKRDMKFRGELKEELVEIASQMSPPPKFPW